jgi:phosphonate metabolism-associated iron-containing alcohol dehydrogenase
METPVFRIPSTIQYGAGALDRLGATAQEIGIRHALLVTDKGMVQLGIADQARERLEAAGARVTLFDGVEPDPTLRNVADGLALLKLPGGSAPCDGLVAVGGGSSIDCAKAIAVQAANREPLPEFMGVEKIPRAGLPVIAVPTTAGTGSEVTPWATVWDRAAGRKHSLHLPQTWPEAAVVDPDLTTSLPAGPTLAAGLDALSHALEAIWNVNSNPVSDTHAVAAARTVLATLPELMHDLDNRELRTRMSQAALQAGLAFSNTKTALAHSISYEMTLRHGLPHGIACSFTLPMVLARASGIDHGRDAVLARIFGEDLGAAPARLTRFLEELGVSTRFSAYGVSTDDEARIVTAALDGVRGKNFIGAGAAPSKADPA